MTQINPITIAVIGIPSLNKDIVFLEDSMLFHAFMLMSLNLSEAIYTSQEGIIKMTYPLKYNFSKQSILFYKNNNLNWDYLLNNILSKCDGIIISLAYRITMDINMDKPWITEGKQLVCEMLKVVQKANLPTILAVKQAIGAIETGANPLEPIVKQALNIPVSMPVVGYCLEKPASIPAVLSQMLTEIQGE